MRNLNSLSCSAPGSSSSPAPSSSSPSTSSHEPLLVALGQDPQISAVAGTILLWYIPVMFSYVWSFTLQMYLQAQSKNMIN